MTLDPKPCPFCGEKPATNTTNAWCYGPLTDPHGLINMSIAAWNRRSTAPSGQAPLEGVWPDFKAPQQYENPAEGWTDPALPDFRAIWDAARSVGYSVGLHGSMKRDCDLIAAPWTDDAVSPEELVEAICRAINARRVNDLSPKPLGRVAITLQIIDKYAKPIDLSIAPRLVAPPYDLPPDWMDGFTACALLMSGQYARYANLRDIYLNSRSALASPAPAGRGVEE